METIDAILFKKYGMKKSIKIDKDLYDDFEKALSDVILVATLNGYEIRCEDEHRIPHADNTIMACMFCFIKDSKVLFNVLINVNKKNMYVNISVICIQKYKPNNNKNFNLFSKEYTKLGLYDKEKKKNKQPVIFSTPESLIKGCKLLEKLSLLFE